MLMRGWEDHNADLDSCEGYEQDVKVPGDQEYFLIQDVDWQNAEPYYIYYQKKIQKSNKLLNYHKVIHNP